MAFGLMAPEERERLAVKRITRAEVYDADGYPVEDGVMDPALGVIDPGMVCRTCGGKMRDCNGHFGGIKLSKPVVNVMYVKQIRDLLRFTCNECFSPLIADPENMSTDKEPKPEKNCPDCGKRQKKVKFDKPYSYYAGERQIRPEEIRERFKNVPDELLEALGFNGGRPEWLVMDNVLVPPVTVRPSITLETGERSEDDLTHKLVDIIRINQRLRNNIEIEAPEFIIDDLWELLQYHVATLFDNTLTGVPPARHRSGRPLKSLVERLKGKEGRFRQNLIGKRANFSARTVISPDPNLDIDQVGIPYMVAKELTIPVKVTQRNIHTLKKLIRNGEDTWPGANYVKRPDGGRKQVTQENKTLILEELEPGYIVERHLQDDDVVLFNRQPSLHRMSIMAHRVKVMPYRTFRLNLCVCAPYNADFDGDEMNLHVPQDEEARAEAAELLKVEKHIKSPKFGGPIIGMIQDSISGLYLLTREDTVLSREEAFDLLCTVDAHDKQLPDDEEITGQDLFSLFLPEEVNISTKKFTIENGQLVEGRIGNAAVGDYGGALINYLLLDHGEDAAVEFLNKVSRLGIEYLVRRGFSIGLQDIAVPADSKKKIDEYVENGVEHADEIIQSFEDGSLERIPGKTAEETREIKVITALREVSNEVEKEIKANVPETSARIMAESGARGSLTNLSVMSGLLGQETIRGERISRGFKHRSLPHFKPNDFGARARGFVSTSIYDGLDPVQMFYVIMSGREGLMDQSLRTRTSGYMYRRVSNAMQDLRVHDDRSVRSADGVIIQFLAGEDGVNPQKSNRGKLLDE